MSSHSKVSLRSTPDGSVTAHAVYSDKWRCIMEAIGTMDIVRASDVEFDSTTGEWVATLRESTGQPGTVVGRDKNRARVIQSEVEYIEKNIIDQSSRA